MKIKFQLYLTFLFVTVLFLSGCTKVDQEVTDPEKEVFNFIVTESQRAYINGSRGEGYEITDPIPELQFAGSTYTIDRFEIRGANTLNLA
jgi:hypothetical protein